MIDLITNSWPVARAGDAIQAVAMEADLPFQSTLFPPAPRSVQENEKHACRTWIESAACFLHLQIERRPAVYRSLLDLDWHGPLLLQIAPRGEIRLVAIVAQHRRLTILRPDRTPLQVTRAELAQAIGAFFECGLGPALTSVLDEVAIEEPARIRMKQSLIAGTLGDTPVAAVWQIGIPAFAGWLAQIRYAGLFNVLAAFLSAYGIEYGLWIIAWVLLGKWALEGRFSVAWLLGWALLLLTLIPVHMLAAWQQGKFAICCGWTMMRLLLEASFRLKPEEVRNQGAGQLLSRVLESEAFQSLALTGGLSGIVAVFQLIAAFALFTFVMKTWPLALALASWTALTVALGIVYHHRRSDWTDSRLGLSQELIERMIGHRTRAVQQPREHWHDGEDEALADYLKRSRCLDAWSVAILAFVPRGWLVAALAVMAHGLIAGNLSPGIVAAEIGASLLAFSAFSSASSSLAALSGAAIAAQRASDLLKAISRAEHAGDPALVTAVGDASTGRLLDMREVSFRYPNRAADAIRHNSIQIEQGERVLLEGPSGSGKSTWVGLVSGLRVPDSGLLLMRGIDRGTLGELGWRRRVVASPQFHENHLLTGSLAFNLLLGRNWPPEPDDLAEAEAVCRELGLGPMLDAMPAGLMQIVGETGWQLSNGEKSRLFLARALLQRAQLVVLDETLGGLDPETTHQAIDCVLRRAPALLCVAHV